ncbi:carbamoyltransferase HypF [Salidesulfovibrio onnuriiensis]|uniref:carbamoyltransferase HypF n=1 Tax=Salidesulfovibrio onnuriiensis TaxID=2583823 RepID=UPI0011CA3470|nr:carbamoyltransferase HypF [Salidesulfovibrio onnuriiensis]
MARQIRRRFIITGQVQGVGFRPFVFRIATENQVSGSVRNSPEGVVIEVQADQDAVECFTADLATKLPPLARIVTLDTEGIPPVEGETGFEILKSTGGHGHSVLISPDVATCADCLADMRDPENPRFRYPFTNCTNCGPRYTITRSIPYDRPGTSMGCFPLCPSCQREYEDPLDRRFHAQPNACPECGPEVWLTNGAGEELARGDKALRRLAAALAEGRIAAIKGLGGFHLACDAANEEAVRELRRRKNRPDKPLAVMVPDMDAARKLAEIMPEEEEWLTGIHRPIVLASKAALPPIAPSIAPDTNFVGVMLPYTPLHHVLFEYYAALCQDRLPALVMTSGNFSSEPICLGNREALKRLPDIADIFLLHNRDILIRCDDSVLRMNPCTGSPIFLRRARGFTPSPVFLPESGPTVLGTGPELKCTMTLTKGDQAFPSQHIGTMANLEVYGFYREILSHLESILQVKPELVVHDLHPDYMTTTLAGEIATERNVPRRALQHHYAHIHAVLAENRHLGPAIGLALDGTGYGEDGTIWGGECLWVDNETLEHQRLARFAHIRLPGGETAVREPWRLAQAALWELGVREPGTYPWPWLENFETPSRLLPQLLEKNINAPLTSSCGRLFDAVAGLLGLAETISYEGQAAILLEKIQDMSEHGAYPCPLTTDDEPAVLDTLQLVAGALEDLERGVDKGVIARRFHLGLINGLAEMAAAFSEVLGTGHIALSGGVMQNLTIASELPMALELCGLQVLQHTVVPPNDACISLGQAAWGQRLLALEKV